METAPQQQQLQEQVFEKFESYDFGNDATFQTGLQSIVRNNQDKTEREQQGAVENAKYFYFARFVQSFDYGQYRVWRANRSVAAGGSTAAQVPEMQESSSSTAMEEPQSAIDPENPSYPKSFQEICELIAAGKPIPGIRQIPNNLAEGTPSEAKLAPKLKPWEQKKAAAAASVGEGEGRD